MRRIARRKTAGQALTINGTPYTLLYSMSDVQSINNNLAAAYALARSLDASGTTYTDALVANAEEPASSATPAARTGAAIHARPVRGELSIVPP